MGKRCKIGVGAGIGLTDEILVFDEDDSTMRLMIAGGRRGDFDVPPHLSATSIVALHRYRLHCSFRLIRSLRYLRPLDALSSLTSCTSHYPLETTRAP